jgi:hypothetical protein
MSSASYTGAPLPTPAEWPTPRPRSTTRVLTLGFGELVALGIAGLGARAASQEPGFMVILGVGILSVAGLTALDLWLLRRRRRTSSRLIALRAAGSAHDGVAIFYASRLYDLVRKLLLTNITVVVGFG